MLTMMFLVKRPHISEENAHVDIAFRRIDAKLAAQFWADFELQRHLFSAGGFHEVLAHRGLRRRCAFAVGWFLELMHVNHDVFSVGVAAVGPSGPPAYSPRSAPG